MKDSSDGLLREGPYLVMKSSASKHSKVHKQKISLPSHIYFKPNKVIFLIKFLQKETSIVLSHHINPNKTDYKVRLKVVLKYKIQNRHQNQNFHNFFLTLVVILNTLLKNPFCRVLCCVL